MNLILIVLTFFGVNYIYYYKYSSNPGIESEPLILTDYLNNGQANLGRQLSRVEPFAGNIESYSGFFRVSDDCVRNMFFWFFPAQNGNTAAPLLVWLQGGPGASSLFALFAENGPYYLDSNNKTQLREVSWTQDYSVIYIDNPVGAGFSFSETQCYLTNEAQVGEFLSILMEQFYQLFPHLKANPLYITGESYAGKYIPAMMYAIHEKNKNNPIPINLQGMIIGDGLCDPYNMMDYGAYLYHIGLIFDNQVSKFDYYRDLIRKSIEADDYMQAFRYFDVVLNGDITPYSTLFHNLTGLTDYFDYYADFDPSDEKYTNFVNQNSHKLHAGNLTFKMGSSLVEFVIVEDIMKSVVPYAQVILNHGYKTLFFSGQFDLIVPYPATTDFLNALDWNTKEYFMNSDQTIWYSKNGEKVNGYVRSGGNVMQILVRNAGHMVPQDQPDAALEMITNFIYDIDF